jgi:hypothetical protein
MEVVINSSWQFKHQWNFDHPWMQGDPYDSSDEEWMAHLNHPTFMPLENVGGQTHMDIKVDMVGLVNDAFVIVDQIA